MKQMKKLKFSNFSVVIPAYNAQATMQDCLDALAIAIGAVEMRDWEIIIVDDGSTDNTADIINSYQTKLPIKRINQTNHGRFATRAAGAKKARFANLLFLDTKAQIMPEALIFLAQQQRDHPERMIWNSSNLMAKDTHNIVTMFNEASVQLVWGAYHNNPRLVGFGSDEFDYYPKGTTCLYLPKQLYRDACSSFSTSKDTRYVSDDTRLLRAVATTEKIWISPNFCCRYLGRTSIQDFVGWVYNRGILFVDSYLHRGTRFCWLIIFGVLSPVVFIGMVLLFPILLCLPVLVWLAAMLYFSRRLSAVYLRAIATLSWLYVPAFLLGIYKGVALRLLGRTA